MTGECKTHSTTRMNNNRYYESVHARTWHSIGSVHEASWQAMS